MHRIVTLVFGVLFLAFAGVSVYKSAIYEREVGGHLKLAADANSIGLAERKLTRAVEGMDKLGLCPDLGEDCYTSVLWRVPADDVGFWRENIEGALTGLKNMTAEERADNLTESNQLIKVRETLVDSGTTVTSPSNISVYPYNVFYFWWCLLSVLGTLGGAIWWWIVDLL